MNKLCEAMFKHFITLVFFKRLLLQTHVVTIPMYTYLFNFNNTVSCGFMQNYNLRDIRKVGVYNYTAETDVFGSCTLLVSKISTNKLIAANYYYKIATRARFFDFVRLSKNNYIIRYDIVALYSILHQLYYLLYNCGLEQASLYVLADSHFYKECVAMNYYFLTGMQYNFIHYIFEHTNCNFALYDFILTTIINPIDFIFIMDYQNRRKFKTILSNYSSCLIGICHDSLDIGLFDIAIPVDTTDHLTQYFFLEYVLSAISAANTAQANRINLRTSQLYTLF